MIIRAKLNDHKRTYRDIVVAPYTNIYALAEYSLTSFGFFHDHSFGFYSSPDVFDSGMDSLHYELFYDIDEEVNEQEGGGVARNIVEDLFQESNQKWWMLFDYGDDWIFELECIDLDAMPDKSGAVVKTNGESPVQYEPVPE